jgi:triosephosphate isomerase
MTRPLIFAANWKMHLGPDGAAAYFDTFLSRYTPRDDRDVWFFPPSVTLPGIVARVGDTGIVCGIQNVYWEPSGAFTGEVSVPLAAECGAGAALIGHSERRHVFGETDDETGRKVRAVLDGGLLPVFCVGERLDEREAGDTIGVVTRQLGVLDGLTTEQIGRTIIAYEPVWAIGTGKTATPADASDVHAAIRAWMIDPGAGAAGVRVLYGGSVKPANAAALLAEDEIDGVLVGGASLDPESWLEIVSVDVD